MVIMGNVYSVSIKMDRLKHFVRIGKPSLKFAVGVETSTRSLNVLWSQGNHKIARTRINTPANVVKVNIEVFVGNLAPLGIVLLIEFKI